MASRKHFKERHQAKFLIMDRKEKHIKDSLKDHEIDLDIKCLWTDVEAELDKQEKKRRGLWLFLLPVILLFTFGVYFIIQYTDDLSDKTAQIQKNETKLNKNISSEQEVKESNKKISAINSNNENIDSKNDSSVEITNNEIKNVLLKNKKL